MKKTFLALSILGEDRPGLVFEITQVVAQSGCNVEDSRMTALGHETAILFLLSGNWNAIAKLEANLPHLEKRANLQLTYKRTEARTYSDKLLPYVVEAVALDRPGLIHSLVSFFTERGIAIQEFSTMNSPALYTNAPMFSAHLKINIPGDLHIPNLRQEFMEFCDEMNLDSIIEPIKN